MKKVFIYFGLGVMFLSSCKVSQTNSFTDDIYANPAEELQLAKVAAQQKADAIAVARAKRVQAALEQQEKDNNNPYYQDPKADPDDYYDYKYASRISRFDNPIYGAGYYDSRYTNYYTYNQNPAYFGSSIYSSYNWMPSNQFYGYNSGLSFGISSGYGFNNFGYGGYNNPMFYDPYNSFGYGGYGGFGYYNNPYAIGYYNGFNNGFNNAYNGGWGYFNSFDANSGYSKVYNGPRTSNGGGNSPRSTGAGMQGEEENVRGKFLQTMSQQQQSTPRFNNANNNARTSNPNTGNGGQTINGNDPRQRGVNGSQPANGNTGTNTNNNSGNNRGREVRENNSNLNTPNNSGRGSSNTNINTNTNTNSNSGGGSRGSGGGSSPRGSSGGGNRPR